MANLIEQSLNKNNPLATVQGYEGAKVEMGSGESVESRVSNIIKNDSPLMQLSKTKAKQGMNRGGLLNSSMALGATNKAVIETALPIASQDANTSSTFKMANQNSSNTADQFSASQANQARGQLEQGNQSLNQITAQGEQQRLNIGANTEAESRLIAERGEIDKALQGADLASREKLLNRQAVIDQELQKAGISQRGEVESKLMQEKSIIDQKLQTAQGDIRKGLLERQGQIDKELQTSRIDKTTMAESQLLNQRAGIDSDLQSERIEQTTNAESQLAEQRAQYDQALQGMRGDQAKSLSKIETASSELRQVNQSATALFTNTMISLNDILGNPDLTEENKQSAIDIQVKMLENSMSLSGKIAGLNLGDLLNFGNLAA